MRLCFEMIGIPGFKSYLMSHLKLTLEKRLSKCLDTQTMQNKLAHNKNPKIVMGQTLSQTKKNHDEY